MYSLTKLVAFVFLFLLLSPVPYNSVKAQSDNSPFDELLSFQEEALMKAFLENKIYINDFKSPNILTGHINFRGNQNFKIEVKLTDRMVVCVERVPGVNRQVCANDAVLNIANSDRSDNAKRYLIYTVSYFRHDDKKENTTLYYSYRYGKGPDDLFSPLDIDAEALKGDEDKIRPVARKLLKGAEALAKRSNGKHPVIPNSVPRIELLDLTNQGDVYDAKVTLKGGGSTRALVKVQGVHSDTKVITFIDKKNTPSLYNNIYEYTELFYGGTFDGGKKVYQLCHQLAPKKVNRCKPYLIKFSEYYKDSVAWSEKMWGS